MLVRDMRVNSDTYIVPDVFRNTPYPLLLLKKLVLVFSMQGLQGSVFSWISSSKWTAAQVLHHRSIGSYFQDAAQHWVMHFGWMGVKMRTSSRWWEPQSSLVKCRGQGGMCRCQAPLGNWVLGGGWAPLDRHLPACIFSLTLSTLWRHREGTLNILKPVTPTHGSYSGCTYKQFLKF